MSLRREILSDLIIILPDNQKEMFKWIAPVIKKTSTVQNLGLSDAESESILTDATLIPIKKTTTSKKTPVISRNTNRSRFRV